MYLAIIERDVLSVKIIDEQGRTTCDTTDAEAYARRVVEIDRQRRQHAERAELLELRAAHAYGLAVALRKMVQAASDEGDHLKGDAERRDALVKASNGLAEICDGLEQKTLPYNPDHEHARRRR